LFCGPRGGLPNIEGHLPHTGSERSGHHALVAVGFEFILKGKATKSGAEAAQGILDDNPEGV
jgi:hypothetical protein